MENSNTIEIKCSKAKFSSERFALEHIKRIQKNCKGENFPVDAYYCKTCGSWHLTSQKTVFYKAHEIEISELKSLVQILKAQNEEIKSFSKKEIKDNKINKMLSKKLAELHKTNSSLRKAVSDLICRNLELEKIIETK